MRPKKEYFILIAIIVLLVVYLWWPKTDHVHYKLPDLKDISSKTISKVEIDKGKQRIRIQKKGDQWFLGKKDYLADKNTVQSIIESIADLKISTLISKSQNYDRYQLNAKEGLKITAWSNEKKLRSFTVGKTSSNYRSTYVKLNQDPNIYLAHKNLGSIFDKNEDQLRDKKVFSLQKKDIQEIELCQKNDCLKLIKNQSKTKDQKRTKTIWESKNGQQIDQKAIDELLNLVSQLNCQTYLDDKIKKESLTDPNYSLSFLDYQKKHRLDLFIEGKEEDKVYKATSTYKKYPFELQAYKGRQIRQAIDDLVTEEEKTK